MDGGLAINMERMPREAYYHIYPPRASQEGRENPPETEKYCCRKMVLFPKALFFVTNFPK